MVLAHGFPSLGYSWRRIIAALTAPGYRVLASDQLGYGTTWEAPTTAAYRKMVGDSFLYMLYFQQPGVADAELDGDPARALRRIISFDLQSLIDPSVATRMIAPGPSGFIDRLSEPGGPPDWLDSTEFGYYVTEFSRTGFAGALNSYRNFHRNWEIVATPATATIAVPALVLIGTKDPTIHPTRPCRPSCHWPIPRSST